MANSARSELSQTSSGPSTRFARTERARRGNTPALQRIQDNLGYGDPPSASSARRRGKGKAGGTRASVEECLRDLFHEQVRLTKSVSRQARLAKLEVSQVDSVQKEQLRLVNNAIVELSAQLASFHVPGRYTVEGISRQCTDGQLLIDQQVRLARKCFEQDERILHGSHVKDGSAKSLNRIPGDEVKLRHRYHELFKLEGPALRLYLNALDRGYRGGPGQWLRSKYARQAIPVLARRGLIGPLGKRDLCPFSAKSPLRFTLRVNTLTEGPVQFGFQNERIIQCGDFTTLVSQSRSRLPLKQWPSQHGKHIWPSHPTLFESWMMFNKGISVVRHVEPEKRPIERISLAQVRENPGLCKKIVRANVLGIRAWIPLPEKLRVYFKYRWGFLIPIPKVSLSIAAARFLLSLWMRAPNQCLLLVPIPLKKFLRERCLSRWISETAHQGRSMKNFFSLRSSVPWEGHPNNVRPCKPIAFVLQTERFSREKYRNPSGGVRLTARL